MKEITKFKDFTYRLEAFGLAILEKLFLVLGMPLSSHIFGTLFMIFGPLTPPTITAMRNIKLAMPELNFWQRLKIIVLMWNNLGRDLAEFIWFHKKDCGNILKYLHMDEQTIKNIDKMQESKSGEIVFTAHFGNWEVYAQIFCPRKIPFAGIYRPLNNEYANKLMEKYRDTFEDVVMIPKGKEGVIRFVKSLREGRKIFMLVDQRLSSGITVPFFNMPAKTVDSVSIFSLKYGYKVYSIATFRRGFSCHFDVVCEEFEIINTGDFDADVIANTEKVNRKIEEWIRKRPDQWFWVHNRWKE